MRPRLRPGTATFAVLDCFLLLGLLGLYLKIGMLDLQWEAIALPRQADRGSGAMTSAPRPPAEYPRRRLDCA